ncbi:MAG TPA: SLC13 family permease [Sphingobacterium sp.]|nr:SLC13 family permease [Sphingobacterium sp.]
MKSKFIHLIIGPILFLVSLKLPLENLSSEGQAVLACTLWVAYWWITEALELSVTSLLPIVIFPLSGAVPLEKITSSYGHPFIFLFMGGFVLGIAIQKWNLHKRIAFKIIEVLGTGKKRVILGFLLATAFLSMWLSNTATAIMILPIGISVSAHFNQDKVFSKNLMLAIAYGASIGGMATLIGSPPNIIFAGILKQSLQIEITFLNWMLFALPISLFLLLFAWIYLTRFKVDPEEKKSSVILDDLGNITTPEKRVLMVFAMVAFLWISKDFLWVKLFPKLDDTIIAIIGALSLFIIPAGSGSREALMNWKAAKSLPWGVLLIFGAGLAIASGFSNTDLTVWLGNQIGEAKVLPAFLFSLLVIAGINFLTEITSNTATASMLLPVLISLGLSLDMDVVGLLAGATLACTCAFMLPVATPPNAIIFGSGQIKLKEMMRAGIFMNIVSVLVIFVLSLLLSGVLAGGN